MQRGQATGARHFRCALLPGTPQIGKGTLLGKPDQHHGQHSRGNPVHSRSRSVGLIHIFINQAPEKLQERRAVEKHRTGEPHGQPAGSPGHTLLDQLKVKMTIYKPYM